MRAIIGFRTLGFLALAAAAALSASTAAAIEIRLDYSLDAANGNFFGSGNPQGATAGAQAKAALEAAADFYSEILKDTFTAIEVPDEKFFGSLGGEATWFWKRRFMNPVTGLNEAVQNVEMPANEYVIFVGARDLPADAVGLAGAGGFVAGFASRNGSFTAAEKTQLDQTEAAFASATKRGQTTGFGRWGGSAAFDDETTWHFDRTTDPGAGTTDFYSVALHELAHALGLGTSQEWDDLVDGSSFKGANAVASYVPAGNVPLASADDTGHWSKGIVASPVYQGTGMQTPILVPGLDPMQTLRQLTDLDAAALADIGWEIDLPVGASAATLVDDGSGGSSSFASSSFSSSAISVSLVASGVPEPNSLLLFGLGGLLALLAKPRRFR